MPAAVTIQTPSVTVQPGGTAIASVLIRNTGPIVDQYAINVVGDASAWARAVPAALSLMPDGEQSVEIHFSPPRSSAVVAGTVPYGVRVTAQEDKDFSVVEESVVQIGGFSAVEAKVVPRTSEAKRRAIHRVEVLNTGNSPVTAEVSASDPDELLAFDIEPSTLTVGPGETGIARMKVASRKSHRGRGSRRMPFNVLVEPGGPPVQVDGAFEQKPKASILLFLAILIVAGVLVVLLKQQADALPLY